MTSIAEARTFQGEELALASDSTHPPPCPTTGDDAATAEVVQFIEQRRTEARTRGQNATGEFSRYLKRIASREFDYWSEMTPERLRTQQEQEAAEKRRTEQRKRDRELQRLLADRGERYAHCRLANFEIQTEAQREIVQTLQDYGATIQDHIRAGQGIVLFGPSGTGKDHLLTAMMRLAITQAGQCVKWRNGPALWAELRDRMTTKDRTENDLLKPLIRADILALSDPTAQGAPLTDYERKTFYHIIDERYNRKRPVWMTVNVSSRQELEELLGVPVVDRLIHETLVLSCNWPSYRRPIRR